MDDKQIEQPAQSEEKPVNEKGGFYFSSLVKIHDPNTQEVILQIRGDE
jgi:hypothetical protein